MPLLILESLAFAAVLSTCPGLMIGVNMFYFEVLTVAFGAVTAIVGALIIPAGAITMIFTVFVTQASQANSLVKV